MRTDDQMKQPFFAKFLEGQKHEGSDQKVQTSTYTKPGQDDVTMKFPSDDDEWITL